MFSSTNTVDIDSVRKRIPGGGRTIARLFMDENAYTSHQGTRDGLGVRIQSPNLFYGSGEASSWVGAGLIDKPIGDFFAGTFNAGNFYPTFVSGNNQLLITVNSQIIPEPEEYALIFGLFALGFVLFHRYRQKKQRQPAADQ